ncbi:hypothetical protein JKP88DRAFT_348626 [Tribonema minus]|uniref:Uncharacterized protein n=1 Tax=Tribonema minus TaxID=303371 RepID=A0A835Z1Y8_9STRA|nr:hypothetical protein JKP88DRAFT_348626 [Tribonema minus]
MWEARVLLQLFMPLGFLGTGKSSIAKELQQRLGAAVISSEYLEVGKGGKKQARRLKSQEYEQAIKTALCAQYRALPPLPPPPPTAPPAATPPGAAAGDTSAAGAGTTPAAAAAAAAAGATSNAAVAGVKPAQPAASAAAAAPSPMHVDQQSSGEGHLNKQQLGRRSNDGASSTGVAGGMPAAAAVAAAAAAAGTRPEQVNAQGGKGGKKGKARGFGGDNRPPAAADVAGTADAPPPAPEDAMEVERRGGKAHRGKRGNPNNGNAARGQQAALPRHDDATSSAASSTAPSTAPASSTSAAGATPAAAAPAAMAAAAAALPAQHPHNAKGKHGKGGRNGGTSNGTGADQSDPRLGNGGGGQQGQNGHDTAGAGAKHAPAGASGSSSMAAATSSGSAQQHAGSSRGGGRGVGVTGAELGSSTHDIMEVDAADLPAPVSAAGKESHHAVIADAAVLSTNGGTKAAGPAGVAAAAGAQPAARAAAALSTSVSSSAAAQPPPSIGAVAASSSNAPAAARHRALPSPLVVRDKNIPKEDLWRAVGSAQPSAAIALAFGGSARDFGSDAAAAAMLGAVPPVSPWELAVCMRRVMQRAEHPSIMPQADITPGLVCQFASRLAGGYYCSVTPGGKVTGVSYSRWQWLADIADTFGGAHRVIGIPLCRPEQYSTAPPQPLASLLEVGMYACGGFRVEDDAFAGIAQIPGVKELMARDRAARRGAGDADGGKHVGAHQAAWAAAVRAAVREADAALGAMAYDRADADFVRILDDAVHKIEALLTTSDEPTNTAAQSVTARPPPPPAAATSPSTSTPLAADAAGPAAVLTAKAASSSLPLPRTGAFYYAIIARVSDLEAVLGATAVALAKAWLRDRWSLDWPAPGGNVHVTLLFVANSAAATAQAATVQTLHEMLGRKAQMMVTGIACDGQAAALTVTDLLLGSSGVIDGGSGGGSSADDGGVSGSGSGGSGGGGGSSGGNAGGAAAADGAIPCVNTCAHMTLATAPGVAPRHSNNMLEGGRYEFLELAGFAQPAPPLQLAGTVALVHRQSRIA